MHNDTAPNARCDERDPGGTARCIRDTHDGGLCLFADDHGIRAALPARALPTTLLLLACRDVSPVLDPMPDVPVRWCPACRAPQVVLDRVVLRDRGDAAASPA